MAKALLSKKCLVITGRSSPISGYCSQICLPQPAKKLIFMGGEIAQWREWNHDASLDWHLLDHELHRGMKQWVSDLNHAYRREKALHVGDCHSDGFMWVDCDNADESIISWERIDPETGETIVAIFNYTPIVRENLSCRGQAKWLLERNPKQRCSCLRGWRHRKSGRGCIPMNSAGTGGPTASPLRFLRLRPFSSNLREKKSREVHDEIIDQLS